MSRTSVPRVLYVSLEAAARLSAAFLCGAMLFVGYFVGRNQAIALVALPGGVALWVLAVMVTRGLRIPRLVQVGVMIAGFVVAGFIALAVSLSNFEMD